MGKIKNWNRISKDTKGSRKSTRWKNSVTGNTVTVENRTPQEAYSGMWIVYVPGDINPERLGRSKTRTKAEKAAVQWMRNHPRG
jgi:hypothetical protein